MSKAKHTPGPWTVGQHPAAPCQGYIVKPVLFGAHTWRLPECEGGHTAVKNKADAHLIAAAPDMLAALERQLTNMDRWLETGVPADAEESESIYNQMVAAVAKAMGEDK